MLHLQHDFPGLPAHNVVSGNTYCECKELSNTSPDDWARWHITVSGNTDTGKC